MNIIDNWDKHPVLMETNFTFTGQVNMYRGKVRDMYFLDCGLVVMIATDRLSAFDHILPRGIPYKGRVLSEISIKQQNHIRGRRIYSSVYTPKLYLIGTHAIVTSYCSPIPLEIIVRGYLSGHAFRQYKDGERIIGGVKLPDGLKENDPLEKPIITPTLKGKLGQHDEDVTPEKILELGIVTELQYNQIAEYALNLYKIGSNYAQERNLILIDTKYEFGCDNNNNIMLIDEVHTPDSARFFDKKNYIQHKATGTPLEYMSKEFVRQWLMKNKFQGKKKQKIPEMSDEIVMKTSKYYIELHRRLINKDFVFENVDKAQPIEERIYNGVETYLKHYYNRQIESHTNTF